MYVIYLLSKIATQQQQGKISFSFWLAMELMYWVAYWKCLDKLPRETECRSIKHDFFTWKSFRVEENVIRKKAFLIGTPIFIEQQWIGSEGYYVKVFITFHSR